MPEFIQGLELSRLFYTEAVKPLIDQQAPNLKYSAGLIGSGSEILGYDTEMSSDHHWGPRLMLFLSPDDHQPHIRGLSRSLAENLPYAFRGYSTNFGSPIENDDDHGTQLLQTITSGTVNHRVEMFTIREFVLEYTGCDIALELSPADWLSIPQQKLLTLTAGAVYHDEIGLGDLRSRLHYYPHDVWLYMLACGWSKIGEDEHLAPRAGHAGDELGSAVIAGRLVRTIMQLCFLMERRYAPYPKWFGTGFAELDCAGQLTPILREVQRGETYRDREKALVQAFEHLNRMHNALVITPPITPAVSDFHGRPFMVSQGWRYAAALRQQIQDPRVKAIAERTEIGNIDQYSDNTNMRESVALRERLARLYESD